MKLQPVKFVNSWPVATSLPGLRLQNKHISGKYVTIVGEFPIVHSVLTIKCFQLHLIISFLIVSWGLEPGLHFAAIPLKYRSRSAWCWFGRRPPYDEGPVNCQVPLKLFSARRVVNDKGFGITESQKTQNKYILVPLTHKVNKSEKELLSPVYLRLNTSRNKEITKNAGQRNR